MQEASMPKRLKAMLAQYGPVLMIAWFLIFGLSIAGFSAAISMGFEVDGAVGSMGTLGAAYIATQLIKPLRIILTLAVTPLLAKVLPWWRPVPEGGVQSDGDSAGS